MVGFLIADYGLAISFILITIIQILLLVFCWKYLQIGLQLIQQTSKLFSEKPAAYSIILIFLIINTIFLIFWIYTWMSIFSIQMITPHFVMGPVMYLWYGDLAFWGLFLYYCMTFLVGTICGYWYYDRDENSVLAGFKNLMFHFGSITFVSFTVIFTTLLRLFINHSKKT